MSTAYVGEIKLVGWNFACRGFALCAGQLLPISQNAALFSLLGTVYGGNGTSTFGLPNMQSRIPIGQGQGPGLSLYVMGEAGGKESTTLLTTNMPIHNHQAVTQVTPTYTAPTATTAINTINGPTTRALNPGGNLLTSSFMPSTTSNVQTYAPVTGNGGTPSTLDASSAVTTLTGGGVTASGTTTIGNAGGSLPFSILPPFLTVNYIIALEGIFPSRN